MAVDVTVIIPVHNTGRNVLDGLASLRAQTLPRSRFEAVYVDDGSTDGTGELLDAELAGEENLSVVRIENSGWPGRPRNVGLDRARGEYVFFMDDDDRLGAEALERLVDRARADRADIVVGRMAGVGRTAPREIFQKSRSNMSLRRDRLLLTTLTVHKLFRAEFLHVHGLRFAESRVRLEDHMFMLRAYLRTDAVSVVHDYTCYYWVRHKGVGNISFRRADPVHYLGSVERIFDIVEAETEPGPLRDRLMAHWYRSKLLGRMQGHKYLRQPRKSARLMHETAHSLVRRRIPRDLDDRLNAFTRLRATALRTGRFELVRRLAEFEEELAHTTTVTGARWSGSVLSVDVRSTLVRRGDGRPLEFVREGDAVYWDLPPELAEVAEVREAARVNGPLRRLNLRVFARNDATGADVTLPMSFTVTELPTGVDRFAVRLTGTAEIDVARGDLGAPMLGEWHFLTRVDLGGTSSDDRLGPARDVAEHLPPALLRLPDGAAVLATPGHGRGGRLVLAVDPSWRELGRALADPRGPAVAAHDGHLRLDVPLLLHTSDSAVTLPLRLLNGEGSVAGEATVAADPGAGARAVLRAEVAPVPHQGRWEVAVEPKEQTVPLGVTLSHAFGRWSVQPPRPSRPPRPRRPSAERIYRGLRRRAGRVARAAGLR